MENATEKMPLCPAQLWTESKCRNICTCKTEQDLMDESVGGLSHAVPGTDQQMATASCQHFLTNPALMGEKKGILN